MKKLFLLAVLSAVVCGAAAHPNHIFGVRVGMNIANMTFKTGGVSATPNSVVRPLVAFSYEKSLMHTLPLYFETGLGIAGYGTSISDGAVKLNAYYFEAPALVNWRFGLTEDVSLIPYLGLSMRVGFAGKVKSGSAKADTFGDGGFDRFDMGVRAGIGVEYRRYSFRFGYDAGFLNLSDVSDVTVRNKTFLLQLGYRFLSQPDRNSSLPLPLRRGKVVLGRLAFRAVGFPRSVSLRPERGFRPGSSDSGTAIRRRNPAGLPA